MSLSYDRSLQEERRQYSDPLVLSAHLGTTHLWALGLYGMHANVISADHPTGNKRFSILYPTGPNLPLLVSYSHTSGKPHCFSS
jgi:hypothetical protein